ncbi:MAG: DUF4124 domain-containing protein [Pseudomonadales bacterium]|nr:DUF4124 domain-containing protein [Pseudomonadales bacterium]NRA18697.1 DUF4124 domain-containing protein [Oceanospirillaceae bacterium]
MQSINRCTDANGKMAFQNRPCPDSSTSETIKSSISNTAPTTIDGVQLKEIAIGKNKSFTVGLPKGWQATVQPTGSGAIRTLRAVPRQGDTLLLLMSFLPNRQSFGLDSIVLDKILQGIHEQHSVNPDERRLASTPIKLVFSKGVGHVLSYVNVTLQADKKRLPAEYSHLTTGALVIDGITVSVSVLNNDPRGDNYAKALLALATIIYKDNLKAK